MSNLVYQPVASRTPATAPHHRRMLLEESGIAPEVVSERGYWTATRRSELTMFSGYQRRVPALVIPMYSPDRETAGHQLRPDRPRVRDGKEAKYETPRGTRCILDVHPRNAKTVQDAGTALWITEGIKKADALTSRELCTIGLIGVWNWQKDGELLPDWQHVDLNGRQVYVVFDSDVMVKPEVQQALERLVGALEACGATVRVIYLPDAEDGSKVGVDDYLVAGGTVEDLYDLAQPFKRAKYTEVRLSRDERLRSMVGKLWAIHGAMPAAKDADYTARTVYKAMIETAEHRGWPVGEEGVEFYLAGNDGALIASVSQPTFSRHVRALEADGYLRIERPKDETKANRYILLAEGRAPVNINGNRVAREGNVRQENSREDVSAQGYDHRYSQVRAPREVVPELRWSRTVLTWQLNDLGIRECTGDHLARLGKKRGALVEYLLSSGNVAPISDVIKRFAGEKTRPRDFKKRTLGKLTGEDGTPPLVAVEGDLVRLLPDWREALDEARVLGEEQKAHDQQVVNYELKKVAFHNRDKNKPDRAPTQREMDERRREREAVAAKAAGRIGEMEPVEPIPWPEPYLESPPADWMDHSLACECADCTCPVIRYARPPGARK